MPLQLIGWQKQVKPVDQSGSTAIVIGQQGEMFSTCQRAFFLGGDHVVAKEWSCCQCGSSGDARCGFDWRLQLDGTG